MPPNQQPSPLAVAIDDYSAADPARLRFTSRPFLHRFLDFRFPVQKLERQPSTPLPSQEYLPSFDAESIQLEASGSDFLEERADVFEWAVVYENQRGLTVFSVPCYSRFTLLPSDPAPFTVPATTPNQYKKQLSVTLQDYPLPDGAWKWVSKSWMIDMRSDSGEVQHDGFEYNWMFRSHKWCAEVGPFSAGGWVRRRKWIRLMTRPAQSRHQEYDHSPYGLSELLGDTGKSASDDSRSPSLGSSELGEDATNIWLYDDVESIWIKCRELMKNLGRDGRKLELWHFWLSRCCGKGKKIEGAQAQHIVIGNKMLQLTPPRRDQLLSVLRNHGTELFCLFVYPDSRARLMRMLVAAKLLDGVEIDPGLDFWSYVTERDLNVTLPPRQLSERPREEHNSPLC